MADFFTYQYGFQTKEDGKFINLTNLDSTRFPAITSVKVDNSGANPNNHYDIYPVYGTRTYIANPDDISISLSAGNLNVNLGDVENLVGQTNTITGTISSLIGQTNTITASVSTILAQNVTTTDSVSALIGQNNTITAAVSSLVGQSTLELAQLSGGLLLNTTILGTISADTRGIPNTNTITAAVSSLVGQSTLELAQLSGGLLALNNQVQQLSGGLLLNTTILGTISADTRGIPNTNTILASISADVVGSRLVASSTAYANKINVKASAGTLHNIAGHTTNTSAQYIQIYNVNNNTPAGTPVGSFLVPASPAGSNFSIDFKGIPLTTGICVANSTTGATYNAGAADCYFTVTYT